MDVAALQAYRVPDILLQEARSVKIVQKAKSRWYVYGYKRFGPFSTKQKAEHFVIKREKQVAEASKRRTSPGGFIAVRGTPYARK